MVPMDREDNFDLTLESILDEYRGFDPEAPEAVPMPEASFATKTAEAELIDAVTDPLLTPEDLLALQEKSSDGEPEAMEEILDAVGDDDLDAILASIKAEDLETILTESEPEPAAVPSADPEEAEDDVREYHRYEETPEASAAESAEEAARSPLSKLRGFAKKLADIVAPEEDVPAAPVEAEPVYPAASVDAPPPEEEPTQVFQAVAEVFADEAADAVPEQAYDPELAYEDIPEAEYPPEDVIPEEEPAADWTQAVAETFGEEDLSLEIPEEEERIWAQEISDTVENTVYADAEAAENAYVEEENPDYPRPDEDFNDYSEYESDEDEDYEEVERRSFQEAVVKPLVGRIAAISWRMRERREAGREEDAEEEDLGPEMPPRQAYRYYATREVALSNRFKLGLLVSLVLLYLSSGLPVLGLLKNSPRVMTLMCIVLQLTVMLIGLDVLTVGLTAFKEKRPGIESLVLLGCVFSLIDGALCAVFNTLDRGLPYCVVSALAVTFLLYAAYCRTRGFGLTFHVLARSKEPGVLTASTNEFYDGITLSKARRSADGFVQRAEEPGPDAVLFAVLTPYIIAAALVLSLLGTVLSGSIKNAGHIFAAVFCAAAPLAAILSYAVPFKSAASFLRPKGLAVAGWSGASDIGRSRRFVVTDQDLFDHNSITIGEPVFQKNMSEAKIVAYAASVVNTSGCCLTPAFIDLLNEYNYPLFHVDKFRCDGAGGMSGYVADEEVLFGTLEFMRLKGVIDSKPDSVEESFLYVAINHELCGMFPVNYQPMRSVQNALKYLLKGSERPIFAVRDPNITPRMLKERFRTQADGFDFPPFRQRYLLSDPALGEDDPICGVITRTGLAPLLSITKTGKQFNHYVQVGLIASVALLIIGMIAMFWLCSVNLFATASPFHLALYELISALIIPLVCHFIKR